MTDFIKFLPTDEEPVNPHEMEILNQIIDVPTSSLQQLLVDAKDPFVAAVLFLAMSHSSVDSFINMCVPYTKASVTALYILKTVLFFILLFVFRNIRLVLK